MAYCGVSPDARTFDDQLHVHEGVLGPLQALADAVHAEGGAVCGQLAHCGGFSRAKPVAQRRPLGPGDGINAYGLFSGVPFSGTMRQDDFDAALPSSNLRTSTADGRGLDRPASSRHRR